MNHKVKALLVQKGIKQRDIAKGLGVTKGSVSAVVNGHWKSRRVQQAIADALKMPYHKVWRGKAA